MDARQIKQKLRQLKRMELRVRFGDLAAGRSSNCILVWDDFFGDRKNTGKGCRYPAYLVEKMGHETRKRIFAEYLFAVYYQSYKEKGLFFGEVFDPDKLSGFNLGPDAAVEDIKKRFRELAKTHHPDHGGTHEAMVALLEEYQKLMKER